MEFSCRITKGIGFREFLFKMSSSPASGKLLQNFIIEVGSLNSCNVGARERVGQARVHKYHSQSRTIEACKYTIINSSVQIDLHVEEDKYSLVGLTGSGMQPITYIVMCTLSLSYPTPPFLGLELYVRNRRNVYLSFHPFSTNTYHLTGT